MPVFPTFWIWKQKDEDFKVFLDYTTSSRAT